MSPPSFPTALVTMSQILDKTPVTIDQRAELERRISLDRNDLEAYLQLALIHFEEGTLTDAYLYLKEASRVGSLPEKGLEVIEALESEDCLKPEQKEVYFRRIGQSPVEEARQSRKILVITNLLPPQEMGGFGRTVWEFCDLLLKRGHSLRILTADMPHLEKTPDQGIEGVEKHVVRNLKLFGDWREGKAIQTARDEALNDILHYNSRLIMDACDQFAPDCCMLGNLDFIGWSYLKELVERKIPLLHRLGNASPGYPLEAAPGTKLYCLAGCSNWLVREVKKQGYNFTNTAVLHPGSPIEQYYRAFLPDHQSLRICFAGLLLPYKGSHILIEALAHLKQRGVDFTCEFAGDTTDSGFTAALKDYARNQGFADSVKFPGFLNKHELAALYSRSNVMVFPSLFDEPFGKSQIEAMAAGLTVISSGTGGSREIVQDGKNGLIFESGNPRSLADRLVYLIQNRGLWEQLSLQGTEDAFKYTTLASVEKIEALFEEMLKEITAQV